MSAEVNTLTANDSIKYFRFPRTVIARFVSKRTVRSAALWALLFGVYVAAKADGYAKLYPTAADRMKFLATFTSNTTINAILGDPHGVSSVAGFTAWNCLMIVTIISSIWALLLATKLFRGEEEAGRWELLIAGQTTARRAAANVLAGLSVCLAMLYGVTALTFIATGKIHNVDFGVSASLFFALAAVSGAAMFLAMGAVASQLMPTRARAAGICAAIFGISFLIRAAGDITSYHWLLDISPLGWVEKMQPLSGSHWPWIIPVIITIVILSILTVWIAGTRDIGDSIFADKDSAKAHTKLLKGPFGLSFRLTRAATISWILGICAFSLFFGVITKAGVQAIQASASEGKYINRLVHSSQISLYVAFVGIIYFIVMPLIMIYVASAVGNIRNDEAEGYLDNLLVRPVSRLKWISERIILIVFYICVIGFLVAVSAWAGVATGHAGVPFHSYITGSINAIVPAIFALGIAIFTLGFMPRFTSLVVYSLIAWAFLIEMISSGINLNHWILDTSILTHMTLAPAVSPDWSSAAVITAIGVVAALLGILRFNNRDLQNE